MMSLIHMHHYGVILHGVIIAVIIMAVILWSHHRQSNTSRMAERRRRWLIPRSLLVATTRRNAWFRIAIIQIVVETLTKRGVWTVTSSGTSSEEAVGMMYMLVYLRIMFVSHRHRSSSQVVAMDMMPNRLA
jgi:hypothetical protein